MSRLSHCWQTPISWQNNRRHFTPMWDRNRASEVEACFLHHQATVAEISRVLFLFYSYYPGYIALPTRCARHFSLPHQALGFSRIYRHDLTMSSSPSFFALWPSSPPPPYSQIRLLPSDHHPK